MHTICPLYEGSVSTSWYPLIAVLNTTSPTASPRAPSGSPPKMRPSATAEAAATPRRPPAGAQRLALEDAAVGQREDGSLLPRHGSRSPATAPSHITTRPPTI